MFLWGLRFKNTLFFTYCVLLLLCLSEMRRLLQSSSFWEARRALIGQLSGALWLAEYLKRETEMLSYCDADARRDTTIKPNINEAFVASTVDIITDYNNLYCVSTQYHVCICVRRNDKQQALLYTAHESIL